MTKQVTLVKRKTEEEVESTETTLEHEEMDSKKQINNIQEKSKAVNKKTVSLGVLRAETEHRLNKYININDDMQKQSTSTAANDWQKVEKRRRNKRQTIVGSNKDNNIVQGAPKQAVLHVYRMDKDTTVDSLTKLVNENFHEAIVETITSKYPQLYASFKVTILEENFEKAMKPEIWPQGACVSRFLYIKKRTNYPH